MLKSRVITAIILLVILLLVLFVLPTAWWVGFVVVMTMQGALEWAKLSRLSGKGSYLYAGLTLAMLLALVWFDASHDKASQTVPHLVVYGFSALLWFLVVPTWLIAGWKLENPKAMGLVGWMVLIPTALAMMDLHAMSPSPWILLLIMGLVWVADIGAYFTGRKFGKRKLAPRISPGKTIEGVAGAMFFVTIYICLVWVFALNNGARGLLAILLFASWWWVALAVIGDLFESAIKRQAGVKDSGTLLPGHGGVLDRIDALTSTLPLAAMVILLQ
ncbi:MAG: phosphatidate cytidylyltransferase [Gallionella sp.]|nr:phosphatidate cytidylyltransferase [Gallionella sp.]MDD4946105.1 phosphatidate cytidylyltransferase [Gallionella sp.]MDD5612149.1 phosphatidate cytidylyltransferase [Gallionella sp.]